MVYPNRLIKIQNTLQYSTVSGCRYLKSDGLVGPDEDADPQIVSAHNLCEAGVLGVGEPHPAQLHRHLQAEGPQLPRHDDHFKLKNRDAREKGIEKWPVFVKTPKLKCHLFFIFQYRYTFEIRYCKRRGVQEKQIQILEVL
jgi:hypothetical protein